MIQPLPDSVAEGLQPRDAVAVGERDALAHLGCCQGQGRAEKFRNEKGKCRLVGCEMMNSSEKYIDLDHARPLFA
ncbi:Os06g0114651 [Oryza sativa Japonica Group]|uniref:Os06g0114651 protein n=1 Tax=Oryza sativa subsp. japonica TaxID=39947 RepID=A0A0P0WRI4_ORYSJ|nr:Os06g0114651 [Oryza sativa Japonica Group]